MKLRRIALFVAALSLSTVAVCAQQPSPEPQTLAQAKLVIALQVQQLSELQLRVTELESAFVSSLTEQRKQVADNVKAAQDAVTQEAAAKAAQDAAAKAKATPAVPKH